MESKAWRRGFLGGFAAFAVAVGGHLASARLSGPAAQCPYARQETPVAQTLIEKVVTPHSITQRVALALLSAMLGRTCS